MAKSKYGHLDKTDLLKKIEQLAKSRYEHPVKKCCSFGDGEFITTI